MALIRDMSANQERSRSGARGHGRPARLAIAVAIAGAGAAVLSKIACAFTPSSLPATRRLRQGTLRQAQASDVVDADVTPPKMPPKIGQSKYDRHLKANYENLEERQRADVDWKDWASELADQKGATIRDVKVTEQRDVNELLRLPNPMRPTEQLQLVSIQLDDGTVIDRPKLKDLKALRPSKIRPVTFKWVDLQEFQTGAPKEYDEIIQRLLNSSPEDMQELVRSNWKKFDQAFFFRITELKEDANQQHLKEKLTNLEKYCVDVIQAAQEEARKGLPEQQEDAKGILNSMLEEDGDTLLWPPPPEAYSRLAETISSRATRSKYEDGWFENVLEAIERFGKKMDVKGQTVYFNLAQVCMQRLVTEWLRHDDLWEETKEGQFLHRLMSISHEQWETQLFYENDPLDPFKIREELKIISETKIVRLPIASKLQIYAAKYIQAIVEFVGEKDEVLKKSQSASVGR